MKIKYMKPPVSPEQKAEIRAKGFTIVDWKYAPEGYFDSEPEPGDENLDLDGLTVEELRDIATNRGLSFHGGAGVAKLKQIILEAQ